MLTAVSSSLVIWLKLPQTASSLSFPRNISASAKQQSVRAWLWMRDVGTALDLLATSVSLPRRSHAKLRDARTLPCFAFLPTDVWREKVTARHCLQCRFPVDLCSLLYSLCCARLSSYKLLVPQNKGSSNHFSCQLKFKEVHLIWWLWNREWPRYGRALFELKLHGSYLVCSQ